MAEFKKEDWYEDEFINAPLQVKKNLLEMLDVAKQVIATGPKVEAALNHAKTISDLNKQTAALTDTQDKMNDVQSRIVTVTNDYIKSQKKLSLEEIELAKVTKATEVATARQSKAYIDQKKVLDQVNKTTKEKTALGDKESKTLTAQNASIKELSAALSKNRAAYEALSGAEKRNSKEGKELLAVIQQQDKELKTLKSEIGQNQLKVGDYEGAMKGLKDELKAAKDELAGIALTLGEGSPEFVKASQKAGDLQNQLNAIQEASKDLSGGSGFEKAGDQLSRFVGQFKAGDFKGATATLKGLSSTVRGLTFKESIAGAGGFVKAIGAIGKAIFTNPLFLVAATVVGIGVAVAKLKDRVPFLTKAFDLLGQGIDFVVQKGKEFSDWALGSEFIAGDRAEAQAEASKKEIEAIRERYDFEIAKAEAAGKETTEIEKRKNAAIEKEARRALAELNKLENRTPEQVELIKEFVKIAQDGRNEDLLNEVKHQKELQDLRDKAAEERAKKEEAAWNERKKRLAEEAAAFKLGLKDQREQAAKDFGKINDEINKGVKGRFEKLLKSLVPVANTIIDYGQVIRNRWIEGLEKVQQFLNTFGNAVGDLFAAITAGRIQDIDEEQKASEQQNKKQIEDEKDRLAKQLQDETLTAEQRDQLKVESDKRTRALEQANEERQLQFEARRRAALRKQAIYEKALALSQAIIAGALAVVKALPVIPLSVAAGALAAIQVAAIAARPIPAAEKGIEGHKGGPIIAGEKGQELVKIPGRKPMLTDSKATLYNLPAGTSIEPHEKTMQYLARIGSVPERLDRSYDGTKELKRELRAINNTIKNKKEWQLRGFVTGYKQGSTHIKYVNSLSNR